MFSPIKRMSRLLPFFLVFLFGAVAGCQSDADGLAKNVKTNDIKAPSTEVEESYGATGAEITVLLAKGATGVYEGTARDVRDGAALGVGELGANQVFVKVIDVSGAAAGVPALVSAAKARNSALLVSYASPAVTSAIAAMPSDQRPPLVNLGATVPASSGNVLYEESQYGTVVRVTFFAFRRLLRYPRSEPDYMTRLVAEPDPAYIRSAVRDSGTNIPLAADKGSGRRDHSTIRHFRAKHCFGSSTWIRQD
jgi:hypothetical protein